MTGNTKIWRAPLAGLASVAMLATMGVAAATANAATVEYDVTLHANGGEFITGLASNPNVVSADKEKIVIKTTVGDTANPKTLDEAVAEALDSGDSYLYNAGEGASIARKADNSFTGWYAAEGAGSAVDPNSALTGSIDLYAHWSTDPVNVKFIGMGISEDDSVDVAPADTVADWQIPGDAMPNDDKLINYWAAASDTATPVYPDQLTAEELWKSAPAGQSGNDVALMAIGYKADEVHNVTFMHGSKAITFYDGAKFLAFNKYSYDVHEGTEITAPLARYKEDPSKYVTAWRADNDKNNAVFPKAVNQDYVFRAVDNAHGYLVNFYYDAENKTNSKLLSSATVGEDEAVAKPADPTRDGYTFVGWVDDNNKAWNFKNNVTNSVVNKDGVLNLYAQWTLSSASVKFHTNSDDVESVIVKSFADGDKFAAPEVSRNGYVLVGWYSNKELTDEVQYFGRTLRLVPGLAADEVTLEYALTSTDTGNTGNTVTYQPVATELYAKWKAADESAIKDQEAVTPAKLLYTDGDSSKPYLSESKYFTTKSFNEFTDWYDATYLPAKEAASEGGYTRGEAAKLVSMLQEAQSKLVFKADVTVYRFEKNGIHIYAQGKRECDNLIASGWKHEADGDLQTVNAKGLPKETVDALLTKVHRLRNKATGKYMLTADQNEIDVLTNGTWKDETLSALYAPKNGTTPVYRFYVYSTGEHLVTADANEYNVQTTNGVAHGDSVKFYL